MNLRLSYLTVLEFGLGSDPIGLLFDSSVIKELQGNLCDISNTGGQDWDLDLST